MYQISVFISHSWQYPGHYETLSKWIFQDKWLINRTPIIFLDVSVPRNNPIHDAPNDAELYTAIFYRILQANVVVIPTGMYTNYSKWILKELQGAKQANKPILAVNPWGQERKSEVVVEASSRSVGWNKKPVINAIWQMRHG
jgi:hypothetical protein